MKSKTLWSKIKSPRPLTEQELQMERKLLPRLRLMGYVCFLLFFVTLVFALTPSEESNLAFIEETAGLSLPNELLPEDVLNFYIVASTFASVGAMCLFIARKKKKKLFCEIPKEDTPSLD